MSKKTKLALDYLILVYEGRINELKNTCEAMGKSIHEKRISCRDVLEGNKDIYEFAKHENQKSRHAKHKARLNAYNKFVEQLRALKYGKDL